MPIIFFLTFFKSQGAESPESLNYCWWQDALQTQRCRQCDSEGLGESITCQQAAAITGGSPLWPHGPQPCPTQWSHEPCRAGPPATDRSQRRALTKRGPLDKGRASHFSIPALRTPRNHGVAQSRTRLSDWTELSWIHCEEDKGSLCV